MILIKQLKSEYNAFARIYDTKKNNKCNNPVIIVLQRKTQTNQKTNKWIKILLERHHVINMMSKNNS